MWECRSGQFARSVFPHMDPKLRKIEVDAETADVLEARAAARGMTVSQPLARLRTHEPEAGRSLAA